MTEARNLLTIDETAKYLSLTPETVRRLIRRGELRATKLGKVWRVPREVLRRLESDESAQSPTGQAGFLALAPDESARRLAALDALGEDAPDHRAEANLPPLDLSGEREDVYGYSPREDAQR